MKKKIVRKAAVLGYRKQKLTPAQMERLARKERVAIAKDVIKQVKAGRFIATSGIYCTVSSDTPLIFNANKELKDAIKDVKCEVCAKGAFFLARVDRKDALKMGVLNDVIVERQQSGHWVNPYRKGARVRDLWSYRMRDYTQEDFPTEMFNEMEHCFESAWVDRYTTDRRRMLAIAENIIRNRGRFWPADPKNLSKRDAIDQYGENGLETKFPVME